jgi:superfamily I DNA and/or RNA helicase
MIGDHHQLPPVVKNMAIQQYSHLDQSLFTRFIRLGTPYIELNAQVGGCAVRLIGVLWARCGSALV